MSESNAPDASAMVLELTWEPGRFPVDPVNIAKQFGIKVLKTMLPAGVSAAIIKKAGEDPIIYLHESDSDSRKRFSCAHELGHFIQRLGEEEYEWVDHRKYMFSDSSREIFANQFAANLLMPEKEIRNRLKYSKIKLVDFFSVSGEAIQWRLSSLGIKHKEFTG